MKPRFWAVAWPAALFYALMLAAGITWPWSDLTGAVVLACAVAVITVVSFANRKHLQDRYPDWTPPGWCQHTHIRCVHGDEIVALGMRRRLCLDCGKALRGPLPELCFYSGDPHPSVTQHP